MGLGDDAAKGVLRALIPPGAATDDHVFRYRLAVSGLLLLEGAIIVSHIAWACGFLAFIGMQGFAQAGSVQNVENRQFTMQRIQLATNIRDLRREQCEAMLVPKSQPGAQTVLTNVTSRLSELKGTYKAAIGDAPDVPECDELVIGAPPGSF